MGGAIVATLNERILAQANKGKLPSAPQLARSLGVSLGEVHKELRELEQSKRIVREYRVNESGNWTLYVLRHPVSGITFYVGITERPLAERLAEHIADENNRGKRAIIRSILRHGKRPVIEAVETGMSEAKARRREKTWIGWGWSKGWPLVNETGGG